MFTFLKKLHIISFRNIDFSSVLVLKHVKTETSVKIQNKLAFSVLVQDPLLFSTALDPYN
jgi:hypothetical protein